MEINSVTDKLEERYCSNVKYVENNVFFLTFKHEKHNKVFENSLIMLLKNRLSSFLCL